MIGSAVDKELNKERVIGWGEPSCSQPLQGKRHSSSPAIQLEGDGGIGGKVYPQYLDGGSSWRGKKWSKN